MGGDTVTTFIYNLVDWFSGNIAVAIGILVVIWSGYEMLHGEIDKRKFLIRGVAIAVIIGGSYITKTYLLKGIS